MYQGKINPDLDVSLDSWCKLQLQLPLHNSFWKCSLTVQDSIIRYTVINAVSFLQYSADL